MKRELKKQIKQDEFVSWLDHTLTWLRAHEREAKMTTAIVLAVAVGWLGLSSWTKARAALNLNTPFDFVTTNDIVGGNSGSPVINARGELVGLIFDGNIQSLPGYFVYDGAVNRAVSVDARGMLEALRAVYKLNRVADELTASPATKTAAR